MSRNKNKIVTILIAVLATVGVSIVSSPTASARAPECGGAYPYHACHD